MALSDLLSAAKSRREPDIRPLRPVDVRLGMLVNGSWRIVGATDRTVTIASASRVDVGARFSGRRYTYRWDGTGFKRSGSYLYATPEGSAKQVESQVVSLLPHPDVEYLYVEVLLAPEGAVSLGRVVDYAGKPYPSVALTKPVRQLLLEQAEAQVGLLDQAHARQAYAQFEEYG
jgi:hypothetical protein